MFLKWCLACSGLGCQQTLEWRENEGQKQVGTGPRADQDSSTVGRLGGAWGKGPLRTQHTCRWTPEEVCSFQPLALPGLVEPPGLLCARGPHSLQLRSPGLSQEKS